MMDGAERKGFALKSAIGLSPNHVMSRTHVAEAEALLTVKLQWFSGTVLQYIPVY